MNKKVSIFLLSTLVLSTVLISGLTVNADKPKYCEKYLDFYPAGPGEIYLKGWISGDLDGYFVVYHLDPIDESITGKVTHCLERWEIWEDEGMTVKLLSGSNTALVNFDKMKWWAQGDVEWVNEEYESGLYINYLGSRWHSEGIFIPGPEAPAYIRLIDSRFIIN
jgi:hypothetical protein